MITPGLELASHVEVGFFLSRPFLCSRANLCGCSPCLGISRLCYLDWYRTIIFPTNTPLGSPRTYIHPLSLCTRPTRRRHSASPALGAKCPPSRLHTRAQSGHG